MAFVVAGLGGLLLAALSFKFLQEPKRGWMDSTWNFMQGLPMDDENRVKVDFLLVPDSSSQRIEI